jgi:glucosamine--fructose-6-phosphate aminotransferase (isomerizing)
MCGIIGAVAHRNIVPLLIEGLRRLEYRGYDSCGVAVVTGNEAKRVRSVARVANLDEQVSRSGLTGQTGLAHTRWATHGTPAVRNAHPIFSLDTIALVHNGIIENHESLRDALSEQGYEFVSETDTEVIAHLVHSLYSGDLLHAVREAVKSLHGAYAIAAFSREEPARLIGTRVGSPLVIGIGEAGNFLSSDTLAFAGITERFIFLEDGDVVDLQPDAIQVFDRDDNPVEREVKLVPAGRIVAELGPYKHFMQKEIFEQAGAIGDRLEAVDYLAPALFGTRAGDVFPHINSVLILGCGTSYYSGMTAKHWLESIAGIPTQVEVASEYRYRDSVPNPNALVVAISQSGETADTLAALKHAQSLGHLHTLAVCNVATSALVRETTMSFLTHAGMEIGVASTKGFSTQLTALFLLATTLGKLRGHVDARCEHACLASLRQLPVVLNRVLALEPQIVAWAEQLAHARNVLFLGRGVHYPIALEGALKLKEISYIHAEAYPAGELKHGPLALVTEMMPVVVVAPNDGLLEKLKSNMHEVHARRGQLYVFADTGSGVKSADGVRVIYLPEHQGWLSPILHVVSLQLLAYHTACMLGTDVDKPRNLAKSVTVE